MRPYRTPAQILELVEPEPNSGCWLWPGDTLKGYGRVSYIGTRQAAHRVSWLIHRGLIPEGLFVCHKCDVKLCVNPDHLFLGTQVDNMQDWTKKGKNRLVNEPELGSQGRHMKKSQYRRQVSLRQQNRFADGVIVSVQDSKGRIRGTKVCAF